MRTSAARANSPPWASRSARFRRGAASAGWAQTSATHVRDRGDGWAMVARDFGCWSGPSPLPGPGPVSAYGSAANQGKVPIVAMRGATYRHEPFRSHIRSFPPAPAPRRDAWGLTDGKHDRYHATG